MLVKSKQRIRELGEVFTAEREVNAMLNLLPETVWAGIDKTFFEPACGDGNFLEKIIQRKLQLLPKSINKTNPQHKIEWMLLRIAASIYGIDICGTNAAAAHQRMLQEIKDFWSNTYNTTAISPECAKLLSRILSVNIQQGDTLNDRISVTQWYTPTEGSFKPKKFWLSDIGTERPKPYATDPLIIFYKTDGN